MINRAEHSIDNRLVEEIAHIKRELNALKTRQLLGGDNLVIGKSNLVTADLNINAGESVVLNLTVTPLVPELTMMEIAWSLYIYGTDLPAAEYLIPSGSSVSMALRHETRTDFREDWSESDDDSGIKTFKLTVHNDGSVFRKFMFVGRVYSPKRSLS